MENTIANRVLTLGHSNHTWPDFERLLITGDVNVVIDVRSRPLSRFPQFNRASMRTALNAIGLSYVYMGVELGGRPADGSMADYEAMAAQPLFAAGLRQVLEIANRARPVLCCSEHEPLQCHRCLLVARPLIERGVEIAHILRDGSIEPHEAAEERLLKLTRQTEADLFGSREHRLARAYRIQNQRLWRLSSSARSGLP